MEVKPITISFKKNSDDRELFQWILSHSNFSGFIKDILRKEMNGSSAPAYKTESKNNNLIDLGDFQEGVMDFKVECALMYMQLLSEYNKTKSEKRKKVLVRKMESIRNGLMPISIDKNK